MVRRRRPVPVGDRTAVDRDGNEAFAYATHLGDPHRQPWRALVELRNELAHRRLPDIDRDKIWRMTVLRPARLREQVQSALA